jgi:D-psicose/D-tagatose/L-ribulose 3-epimerase
MLPAISLIAWGKENKKFFFDLIKKKNINSIEIAPSHISENPENCTNETINDFSSLLKKENINLIGFHSLLYKKKNMQLFESKETRNETLQYIKKIIYLCANLGGKKLIFGSPNNRKIFKRKYQDCYKQSQEDFWEIAEVAKKNNVIFCIEPLAKSLSDFIQSSEEGASLVNSIDHPNFKLHIDTKTILENNEDFNSLLKKNINICEHIHISEIGLLPLSNKNFNHNSFSQALIKYKYNKFLSIEMNKEENNKIKNITQSIDFLKKNYFSNE